MICVKCGAEIAASFKFCPSCGRKDPSKEKAKPPRRGNGLGSVYRDTNGKWIAQAVVGRENGHYKYRRKKGFETKKAAIAAIAELTSPVLSSRSKKVCDIWAEMSPKWIDSLSKDKQSAYQRAYDRMEYLHQADIGNLIAQDWQKQIDQIPGSYYPKRDAKIVVSKLYQYAIAQGWLQANMAEHITLPKQAKPKKDAFSTEELDSLWKSWKSGYEWTAYILIMCYTGMRPGELLRIRTKDIHLQERYMVGGIKSEAGIDRCIAFPSFVVPLVAWAMDHAQNGKLLAINEDNFYKQYDAALDHAGIVRTQEHPMTPHCCRHTFVTMGTDCGIQLAILQKMAGHSDVSVTAGYNHTHDPQLIAAVENLYRPK